MPGMKRQVLSNAIDILLNQGNLPEELDGTRLYGEALEEDDALKADCRVYQLSNETGNGQITVYQVFNGIELYYNDMHMAYCNQDQVKLSKEIAAFITEDLTMHYTIEQLSERFGISMTTLKKGFHGVYGTSVYSWLRNYRMQTAQKLLLETELSVAEIAHQVGYENPNKFSTAFKSVYEITPTQFRFTNNIKL